MYQGDMSWDEAKTAVHEGKKVRNRYFTNEEFFTIKNGNIVCEMGYPMDGWYRGDDWQKEGWSIFQ